MLNLNIIILLKPHTAVLQEII
uniref:Uncharacterized protein n=1 Tax=Anguilla anguilla TaxID=7936 RepID=A0A0E9PMZ3_ANGAN